MFEPQKTKLDRFEFSTSHEVVPCRAMINSRRGHAKAHRSSLSTIWSALFETISVDVPRNQLPSLTKTSKLRL